MRTSSHHPFSGERAQDRLAERQSGNGVFRCDRCQSLWPLPFYEQDGLRLCRRDRDTMSPLEAQMLIAEAVERGSDEPLTSLPLPVTSCFAGVASVTGIAPTSVNVSRGGASKTIVLTGVNFTTHTTTTSGAHVSASNVVDSSSQITVTIAATLSATPGDYNLLFDGDTLTPRGILKVR